MKKLEGISMIIVLKPNCPEEQVKKFTDSLTQEYNVKVNTWVGTQSTVLGLLGDLDNAPETFNFLGAYSEI